MVMITRSIRRKTLDSCSSSDLSQKSGLPPWCSSAKHGRRARPRSPSWQGRSTCELRENIWEYLHAADKTKLASKKPRKKLSARAGRGGAGVALRLYSAAFIVAGLLASLWICKSVSRQDLMTRLLPYTTLLSLSVGGSEYSVVSDECCSRMKYLAEALSRAEHALRNSQRMRKNLLLSSHSYVAQSVETMGSWKPEAKMILRQISARLIEATSNPRAGLAAAPPAWSVVRGVSARAGRGTAAWGARAALWGVLPLWRASPPPRTVLRRRAPAPADCWPLRGSSGELIFELPQRETLRCISIEHIKPDTAKSSLRHFALYGVLENGTLTKAAEGEYKYHGQAKQYFPVVQTGVSLKKIILQINSNHGNPKYTCVYRVQLYRTLISNKL